MRTPSFDVVNFNNGNSLSVIILTFGLTFAFLSSADMKSLSPYPNMHLVLIMDRRE